MEYWEFLLQREGDRTWLPINSKTEIEAGRYRVVAHSSRINTDVEICIIHESTEEIPPKRRSQKRSRRTNPEGLMVVIPFTYLKPGLWELRCCGDIMSDFLGLSWQQSVQLVVLAKATQIVLLEQKPPLLTPAKTEIQEDEDFSENSPSTSEPEITVESTPIEIEAPQPTPLVSQAVVESKPNVDVEMRDEEKESASELAPVDSILEATPSTPPEEIHPEAIAPAEETPEVEDETSEAWKSIQPSPEAVFEPSPATPSTLQPLPIVSTSEDDEIVESDVVLAFLANQSVSPEPAGSEDNNSTLLPEPAELEEDNNIQFSELAEPEESKNTLLPEPAELEEDKNKLAVRSHQATTSTNPILDQSLQMLEQILQQVLEPVMQEFDRAEPSESAIAFELEEPLESATNQQGLILTLDEESLVARRGESLILSGQVDVLDVNQLNGGESSNQLKTAFQGRLRYELRDPQTSQVLVDVQHPLPEQALPIAFHHSLEIPSDCPTRLILGKVTLYESTSAALASQPFTVTADLEELLGAIIPGTQAMPVAKVLVLADHLSTVQESPDDLPGISAAPIKPPVLDLVDVTQNRPSIPLKPSSASPLPPQLYQPTATSKTSRAPQLPKLPKVRPIIQSPDAFVEQVFLPVITESEPERVEHEQQDSVEPPQPINLSSDIASALPTALPADPSDTEPEPQLQDALQQLEEAILQIQRADSLSSGAMTQSVAPNVASTGSNASIPVVEAANGTALPKEAAHSDRQVSKASVDEALGVINGDSSGTAAIDPEFPPKEKQSEIRETPEDADLTEESPLGESEDIDEWAISIYSDDASLNGLEATDMEMPSTAVSPVAESVAHHNREVVSPELELTTEPTDSDNELGFAALGALDQELAEEESEHPSEPEPAVVDNAFQSLNIQDRFWSRLNSLATDTTLSQLLSSEPSPSTNPVDENAVDEEEGEEVSQPSEPLGVDVAEVTQPLTSNTLLTDFDEGMWQGGDFDEAMAFESSQEVIADTEPLQLPPLEENTSPEDEIADQSSVADVTETDWAAQSFEFVVDDEEPFVPEKPLVTHEVRVTSEVPKKASSVMPPPPQREILPPRQFLLPVPAPELSIPTSELAAGEPVTVRVKLPPHPARLSVKLWVQDRQSRSLLDGPRWLMDLIPDRTGEQEALTQLTVPFGSAEIRFEAIAVDIDSQRESHKVALDCVVVPPDLPNFSLDEFDM